MRVKIICISLFCFGLPLQANGRLARAQSDREAHVRKEAQVLKGRLGNDLHSFVNKGTSELDTLLRDLYAKQTEMSGMSFAALLERQGREHGLRQALNQAMLIIDEHQSVLDQASMDLDKNIKQLAAFTSASFCAENLVATDFDPSAVNYHTYETIDVSHIPLPESKGVDARPGQGHDDSDVTVESGAMLAATTTGAAIGSVVPGLGTILGAGVGLIVGAVAGYGAGKAAVAVKVGVENKQARNEYNQAVSAEEARQRREIEQTRAWISQHPIQKSDIQREAARFCENDHWRGEFSNQVSLWQEGSKEAQQLLVSMQQALDKVRSSIAQAQSLSS